jgi:tetratricopeptide (TPR) repeat protein
MALKEAGEYQEALSYMEQVKPMTQRFLAADPNDTRAGNDLLAVLENEAECFEERGQGADAISALTTLSEARLLLEHLLQIEPDNLHWRSTLGLVLIRMSLQQQALHRTEGTAELAAKGVAILKAAGKQPNAQGFDLDQVATGLVIVKPVQFRDPGFAVECAQRMVELSHHRKPAYLLTLAHAWRAAGHPDNARVTAIEGLALLPATAHSRVRKELQAELK